MAARARAGVGHAGDEGQAVDQLAAGGKVVAGAQAVDNVLRLHTIAVVALGIEALVQGWVMRRWRAKNSQARAAGSASIERAARPVRSS